MGNVINLRKVGKAAARGAHERQAAVNRLQHGRTKSERRLAEARDAKAQRDLDRHRIETGDER